VLPIVSGTSLSVNAWTEFGASFGRVLLDKGPHYFKGGITLKYLAGMANGYISTNLAMWTIISNSWTAILNILRLHRKGTAAITMLSP